MFGNLQKPNRSNRQFFASSCMKNTSSLMFPKKYPNWRVSDSLDLIHFFPFKKKPKEAVMVL
jgi:hypothetical protein